VPNTSSSNFYTDLYQTPYPYWNLIIDGKTFTGPWVTNHSYGLGNIAIFGGILYYCITAHTSTAFASDSANWSEYVEAANWNTVWTTNYVYGKNDIVTYGGIVYKCISNHTSASTVALGLEANQSSWAVLYNGLRYVGLFQSGTRYVANDIVKLDGDLYICTVGHTASSTFNTADWATWLPGFIFEGVWSSGTTYQPGDTVSYGGYEYVSNTQNNVGNVPSTDSTDWSLFAQGYKFANSWDGSTAYKIGTVVRRHGMVYESIADNSGQDPTSVATTTTYSSSGSSGATIGVASTSGIVQGMAVIGVGFNSAHYVVSVNSGASTVTLNKAPDTALINSETLTFTQVNYVYWKLFVPGSYWTSTWQLYVNYIVGDIVVYQNGTYVCIANNTSTSSNRPDLDTTNTLWVFYTPHARKNALNTYGDIEYFDATTQSYKAVPIKQGTPAAPINQQSYILRDTGGIPTWSVINIRPNVFYVSTSSGTDRSDYGMSWDQPWKTIAYACNLVGSGFNFPTEVANLKANKTWITTEMIQWTLYQMANSLSGFTPSYNLNQTKAIRDAGFIIDALAYDISRGGNSQTVATTLAYFAVNDPMNFFNSAVTADMPYFLPMINYLGILVTAAITETAPSTSYQVLNGVSPVVTQTIVAGSFATLPTGSLTASQTATNLLSLVTTALSTSSTKALPNPNAGIGATIFVKSGTYQETLPIVVPENVSIVGDELRTVVVEPATRIIENCTSSSSLTNLFTVSSTNGLADQMPVQFTDPTVPTGFTYTGFGGINPGQNYYVVGSSVTSTAFSVTTSTGTYTSISPTVVSSNGTGAVFFATPTSLGSYALTITTPGTGYAANDTLTIPGTSVGGLSPDNDITFVVNAISPGGGITAITINSGSSIFKLTDFTGGSMTVYAGDCLRDMFRMRNASTIRNMTLQGLLGTLGPADSNVIQRPTGGSFACLDPGSGPTDTSVWIFRRSPYVQNVTAFGNGCTGIKIDGTLHNGGNKSMVANDFTHLLSDGIGAWCTGPGALTELISVFSYYGYTGYFAEAGGRIRAANGNSSYGQYGVIAEGYDPSETPGTGIIFNRSSQVQATVQQAYGSNSQLLRLDYNNGGSNYLTSTTNMVNQSNNFAGNAWSSDSNVSLAKVTLAPSGVAEAWTLTGNTGGPDGSYLYQNITIPPAGATFTGLIATSNNGSGATFNVTVTSTAYIVTVNNPGSGYSVTNQLYISGSQLGGVDVTNNCVITVTGLAGSGIQQVSVTGVVPTNSAYNYTGSIFIKKGTAPSIDIQAIYSGSSTVTSSINYNFLTNVVTPSNANGGFLPTNYGIKSVQLSSTDATAGWSRLYFTFNDTTGLNTNLQFRIYPRGYNGLSGQYTYFYGAQVERTQSYSPSFYLEVSNKSKYTAYANFNITGSGTGVITVGDEIRSRSVFQSRVTTDSNGITGGTGYLTASNQAQTGTDQYIQLAQSDTNTNGNYTGMRVFVNSGTGAGQYGYISYYNSSTKNAYVLKESFDTLQIASTSNSTGYFTLGNGYNTSTLYLTQPVQFIPTYNTTSVTSTSLSQVAVTVAVGGTTNTLTVASTVGMYINMPITFSGTTFSDVVTGYTYFIYAIIDSQTVQITNQSYGNVWQLTNGTGSMTMNFSSSTSYIQGSTTNMVVNYPIQFTGQALGGVSVGSVYYINDVINSNNFTISNALVTVSVTASSSINNGLTVTSTSALIPLNPIVFTSVLSGSNIVDSTKYYISQILDSQTFTISSTLISVTVTATTTLSNLITVSSTSGFQTNQPIRFVGNSIGGIVAETTYYILAVNDSTTFTISQTPGGGAINLTTATGMMTANTCPAAFTLGTSTGTMTGTSTAVKLQINLGYGSMNATFSTSLFGGVTLGTTYYINNIVDANNFTVSATSGGSSISLLTKTGSMNIAAVGWDHLNIGTPILSVLDSSSLYYIEPRTVYTPPPFSQTAATSTVTLASGVSWISMAYGNGYWMALPSANATGAYSSDGLTWSSLTLPSSQSWTGIAFGNGYWVIISSGGISNSVAAVSKSNGQGWRKTTLPSTSTWSQVWYGNGMFVATATGTNSAAYSTDYGTTWVSATLPATANWSGLAYGAGRWVAVANGGTQAAYSLDGITWVSSTLPSSTAWSSITYGNNMFLAVSSSSNKSAYTFDGITWYSSNLSVTADQVDYGQGVYVAVANNNAVGWTTEGGTGWKQQTVTSQAVGCMAFGYNSSGVGLWATLGGQSTGSVIYAGAKTKGRATVTSGTITGISEFEPGSNYTSTPTVSFVDPNVTTLAVVSPRIGNGVLSSPTFINHGTGYNTASTQVAITGNGYSDAYQTGLQIIMNNLSRLPQPGDNITIAGVSQIYKVTSAYSVYSTVAPYLEANVSLSPAVSVANSTANGTAVSIRSLYSQARLTNHDFLNIGYGDFVNSNYPGYPAAGYSSQPNNQTVEINYGRVFFTSTDQDGNFKVGNLFGVQQATGIVTLSASQFGLSGLNTISLGGIAVGGSSVVISQFSTDGTFTANSDYIIPTQKSIKTYITSRLSQGGSNTFTGQLTAGTVVVGAPNFIRSTIPNGTTGSVVKMTSKIYINSSGVDGNMAALDFFMRHATHKTNWGFGR
jgi:hypothetical protein